MDGGRDTEGDEWSRKLTCCEVGRIEHSEKIDSREIKKLDVAWDIDTNSEVFGGRHDDVKGICNFCWGLLGCLMLNMSDSKNQ